MKPSISIEDAEVVLRQYNLRTMDAKGWRTKWVGLRKHARQRGLECLLSFKQYIRLASRAGLTSPSQIGCKDGCYHMSRLGDKGGYEWGNCRFLPQEDNLAERVTNGGTARQAQKMSGRSKVNHEYLKNISEVLSRTFKVRNPAGRIHKGSNLFDFCKKHELNQSHMSAVCRGVKSQYKGWTGQYT